MKVFIIWLIGVILWNYGYPVASPLADVLMSVVLFFMSYFLKLYIFKTTSD